MKVSRAILTLSLAHFFIDIYSSMLGAFLPFLHQEFNLSLSQAGILGAALIFSSALLQPLYGYLADRFGGNLFVVLSPGITGIFICALGIAPNFQVMVALVILGGVGVAAFHPQGASSATAKSPDHDQGSQMSVFIAGGMLGYGLGPLYITLMVSLVGLERSYWAAAPGVLMTIYLLLFGSIPVRDKPTTTRVSLRKRLLEQQRPLLLLYLLVVARSINQIVFVSFLPLYFTLQGYTGEQAGQLLTLFLLFGGPSGLLGGILADRFGGKIIIIISTLGYTPLFLGFLNTDGGLSILLCVLGGIFLLLTGPVNVVMGQKLIPEHAGTISALLMGFGWGIGGLFLPLVGALSEVYGLQTILIYTVLLTAPGCLLSFLLPSER